MKLKAVYLRRQIAYHLALGMDVINFGDDYGTPQSLLMPPALFHRIFKPRLLFWMQETAARAV